MRVVFWQAPSRPLLFSQLMILWLILGRKEIVKRRIRLSFEAIQTPLLLALQLVFRLIMSVKQLDRHDEYYIKGGDLYIVVGGISNFSYFIPFINILTFVS